MGKHGQCCEQVFKIDIFIKIWKIDRYVNNQSVFRMETTGEEGKIQVKRKKKREKTIFDIVERKSDDPKNQRYWQSREPQNIEIVDKAGMKADVLFWYVDMMICFDESRWYVLIDRITGDEVRSRGFADCRLLLHLSRGNSGDFFSKRAKNQNANAIKIYEIYVNPKVKGKGLLPTYWVARPAPSPCHWIRKQKLKIYLWTYPCRDWYTADIHPLK